MRVVFDSTCDRTLIFLFPVSSAFSMAEKTA